MIHARGILLVAAFWFLSIQSGDNKNIDNINSVGQFFVPISSSSGSAGGSPTSLSPLAESASEDSQSSDGSDSEFTAKLQEASTMHYIIHELGNCRSHITRINTFFNQYTFEKNGQDIDYLIKQGQNRISMLQELIDLFNGDLESKLETIQCHHYSRPSIESMAIAVLQRKLKELSTRIEKNEAQNNSVEGKLEGLLSMFTAFSLNFNTITLSLDLLRETVQHLSGKKAEKIGTVVRTTSSPLLIAPVPQNSNQTISAQQLIEHYNNLSNPPE